MSRTYERCLALARAGKIRRTPSFTYEDTDIGEVWDDLVYQLADDGLLALGEDGSVHTIAAPRKGDAIHTRSRRRRPAVTDPFQVGAA